MHIQNTRPLPFPRRSPRQPQATRPRQWWEVREPLMIALFLPTSLVLFYLRMEGLL